MTRADIGNRSILFVSHANPQENEFALWLTLRLAAAGYTVWCDLTDLLGGELMWEHIQEAVEKHTVRFLFVSSRASNEKAGTLDELNCALDVAAQLKPPIKDFVIPLQIEDVPREEVYIQIRRRRRINCTRSWADGLAQLLEKLHKEQVPRDAVAGPATVARWWRTHRSSQRGLLQREDEYVSNWLPFTLPTTINVHEVTRNTIGQIHLDTSRFTYPAVKLTDISFVAFAPAEDFEDQLAPGHYVARTTSQETARVLEQPRRETEMPKHIAQLCRMAWERFMEARGMSFYAMANNKQCFYFIKNQVSADKVTVPKEEGKPSWRSVVGYSTRQFRRRYWHYGVHSNVILRPTARYVIKAHVLFSDDGTNLWDNPKRMAQARRSQCKNWWNHHWRDRLLGTLHELGEDGTMRLPVGRILELQLECDPARFVSPVCYAVAEEDPDVTDDDEILDVGATVAPFDDDDWDDEAEL